MSSSLRISMLAAVSCIAAAVLLVSCNTRANGGASLKESDFEFIQLGMSYQEVVEQVGEADREIGSGVHLMVYDLQDGTQMILSFPSLDTLSAAYLYDPESDERQMILGSDA